jgi:hypothetical protein
MNESILTVGRKNGLARGIPWIIRTEKREAAMAYVAITVMFTAHAVVQFVGNPDVILGCRFFRSYGRWPEDASVSVAGR